MAEALYQPTTSKFGGTDAAPSAFLQDTYLFIQGYIIPAILLLGISGNTLSLVIFIRTRKRADASVQYLSTLAISDTGFIIFLGVADWMTYGLAFLTDGKHSFNFYTYSSVLCKVMGFSRHIWEIASAWAIVAFTLERVFIVWFPLKRANITAKWRTKVIITIWILAVCLSVHRVALYHVYKTSSVASCFYNTTPDVTFAILLLDLTIYSYLPCCLIFLANVFILFGIRRAKQSIDSKDMTRKESKESRLIVSLLLVSTLYVIFMSPAAVSGTYFFYYLRVTDAVDPNYYEMLFYVVTYLDQFSLLNYCSNFIIYGCTLPFYRNEVYRQLMGCWPVSRTKRGADS